MTDIAFLDELYAIIKDKRAHAVPKTSYVATLGAKPLAKTAQKVGEEAVETVIAALNGDKAELRYEAADLVFHLLVLLERSGLTLTEVVQELHTRQCKVKK
jgi:phosphoribosyl-ATP pyrophosphohydrolase